MLRALLDRFDPPTDSKGIDELRRLVRFWNKELEEELAQAKLTAELVSEIQEFLRHADVDSSEDRDPNDVSTLRDEGVGLLDDVQDCFANCNAAFIDRFPHIASVRSFNVSPRLAVTVLKSVLKSALFLVAGEGAIVEASQYSAHTIAEDVPAQQGTAPSSDENLTSAEATCEDNAVTESGLLPSDDNKEAFRDAGSVEAPNANVLAAVLASAKKRDLIKAAASLSDDCIAMEEEVLRLEVAYRCFERSLPGLQLSGCTKKEAAKKVNAWLHSHSLSGAFSDASAETKDNIITALRELAHAMGGSYVLASDTGDQSPLVVSLQGDHDRHGKRRFRVVFEEGNGMRRYQGIPAIQLVLR
ncbi:hypothetical protein [Botrimarina mediterranea]|nr:hypothetical protein [Botrimarina mediterranea]